LLDQEGWRVRVEQCIRLLDGMERLDCEDKDKL
jgi:hypothetical protein